MASPIADLTVEINALIGAVNRLAAAERRLTGGQGNTRLNGSTKTEWAGDQARNNLGSGHNQQGGWSTGLLTAAAMASRYNPNLSHAQKFAQDVKSFPLTLLQASFKQPERSRNILARMGHENWFVRTFSGGQLNKQLNRGAEGMKSPWEIGFRNFEEAQLSKASGGVRTTNTESLLEKAYDKTVFNMGQGAYRLGQAYENIQSHFYKKAIADRMRDPLGKTVSQGGGGGGALVNAGRFGKEFAQQHGAIMGAALGYAAVNAFKESYDQSSTWGGRPNYDPNAEVYRPLSPIGSFVGRSAQIVGGGLMAHAGYKYGASFVSKAFQGGLRSGIGMSATGAAAGYFALAALHGLYKVFSGEYTKEFEETKEGMREIGAWRESGVVAKEKYGYIKLGIKGSAQDIEKQIWKYAETEANKGLFGIHGFGGYLREVGNVGSFGWIRDRNTLIKEAIEEMQGRFKRGAEKLSEATEASSRKNFRKFSSKLAQASAEFGASANPAWKDPKKLFQNMQAARLASRNYGSGLFTRGRSRVGD